MNKIINNFSPKLPHKIINCNNKVASAFLTVFRLIFLLAVGFVIMYPLFYMLVTSFQGRDAFINSARVWIPTDYNIKNNYTVALVCLDYGTALLSTLKNEVLSAAIEVCTCAFAAYGLARFNFKEKKLLMAVLFMTILVPDMLLMIPRVINFSKLDFLGILGLIDKLTGVDLRVNILNSGWSFWLPSLFGVGLRSGILIYIYIQFFKSLPKELEEAAWVDGAGPFRTFLSIAIPSSGVVILTVTVFSLVWHWNDTYLSGMFIREGSTLATELANLSTTLSLKYGLGADVQNNAYLMAGCVLFVTPMLIVYMILQRWFIESIDRVGITG